MKEVFRQYGVLVRTLVRNNLFNLLRARRNRIRSSKDRAKSVGIAVAAIFGIVAFVAFEVGIALSLASSAFKSGLYDEVIYVFLTAAQLIVFFFGILTVTSNLYFSKDNAILAPMPFRKSVVFSAKFTVAYFGELFISALFVIPTTVTVGIVADLSGFAFPWYYYPLCAIAALVAPIVPLAIISLISVPLMRLAAIFKRHKVGQALAMTVLYGVFIALYFAMIIGLNSTEPGEMLGGGAVSALKTIKEVGVMNLPLVALMTGLKLPTEGILIACGVAAGVLALLALTFFVGTFFSLASEEGYARSAGGKRKSRSTFDSARTFRLFGRRRIRDVHRGRSKYDGSRYDYLRLLPRMLFLQSRFVDRLLPRGEKPVVFENFARFRESHSLFQTCFRYDSERRFRDIHGGSVPVLHGDL